MREAEAFCNAACILNIRRRAAGPLPLACILGEELQGGTEQLAAFP